MKTKQSDCTMRRTIPPSIFRTAIFFVKGDLFDAKTVFENSLSESETWIGLSITFFLLHRNIDVNDCLII